MKKSRQHKKIFLINRDFQLRYTRAAVAVGVLSTVLTAVIILYPLYIFEILRIPRFLPMPILASMAVAAVVNIGFVALMGIILTHKIAGPMYSLVRHFRLVGMGKWGGQMRVREGDELKFVVRNFNDMIEELKSINKEDIKIIDEIENLISTINENNFDSIKNSMEGFKQRLQQRSQVKVTETES